MVIGYRLAKQSHTATGTSVEAVSLLKQLVLRFRAGNNNNIQVEKNCHGAPTLIVNKQPLFCSISHKDNLIAVAYSDTGPIGIDVENLQTTKDYRRIRDYYSNGFLAGSEPTKESFFYYWTLAEAYAKASGEPLLTVLESPLNNLANNRVYFRLDSFLLCAYVHHSDTHPKVPQPYIYPL